MLSRRSPSRPVPFSLSFLLLTGLLTVILLAGGASRPDVGGQIIVRGAAAVILLIAVLLAARPLERVPRVALALLVAAVALPMVQLIPLPFSWWSKLGGHELLRQAGADDQPWRPLSIIPSATVNAVFSLIVPAAVLLLVSAIRSSERQRVMVVIIALISATAFLGLIQFSGTAFNSPLINDSPGEVSALFANRNHFALFLAFGCLLAPVWGTFVGHQASWRIPLAIGMVILFSLLILASGSRAGLVLGLFGTVIGLTIADLGPHRLHRQLPRWGKVTIVAAIAVGIAAFFFASFASGRAQSFDRLLNSSSDMRTRGLPTVIGAVQAYFPSGAGFGSFDTVFRIHEPFELLKPTYFNHAHDEYLEILIDGGLPGLILLLAALSWWCVASVKVWRHEPSPPVVLGRSGSGLLFLVILASALDYPARTPTIMAIMALAIAWLEWGATDHSPLPANKLDL